MCVCLEEEDPIKVYRPNFVLDQEKTTLVICSYCYKDVSVVSMEEAALLSCIKGKKYIERSPSNQCFKSLMPPTPAPPLNTCSHFEPGVSHSKLPSLPDHFENQFDWSLRLRPMKKRACNNCTPRHEIQRLQTCEKSHATHQVGVWWCAMIITFRTPQFFFIYNEKHKL